MSAFLISEEKMFLSFVNNLKYARAFVSFVTYF